MELQVLDILYITLIVFTTIIGTLLTIVLLRLLKVLWMATEIVDYYNKIKQIFSAYQKIPEMVKQKVKEFISKEEK